MVHTVRKGKRILSFFKFLNYREKTVMLSSLFHSTPIPIEGYELPSLFFGPTPVPIVQVDSFHFRVKGKNAIQESNRILPGNHTTILCLEVEQAVLAKKFHGLLFCSSTQ